MGSGTQIYLLYPNAKWEGCLTAVCRGDQAYERVKALETKRQLRKYRVRAVVADVVPLLGELDDLLGPRPFRSIRLNEDPLQIYLHRGGWNAVYFSFVGDGSTEHRLAYIEVVVETDVPRVALGLARSAFNQLLDSEAVAWQTPLAVARLDLLTLEADDVIVSEIVLPYSTALAMGPLGGLHQSPLFAPWLATLREAVTATSPYWRLLCAWRVYDGVQFLRGQIRKQCHALGITAPLPKDPDVSLDRLREAGLPEEFLKGIKKTSQLFSRMDKMRHGVAHFILKEGAHVNFSDGFHYSDYSIAATVLLHAAVTAIRELGQFYSRHVEQKTLIGSILPERHRAQKFFVRDPRLSAPLNEATLSAID
jgi:hypothetical protein